MSSVNKVLLLGRLGKDPDIRYTPSGNACATFSIATDYKYKDKDGERQTKTEWHRIKAWGKLAEIMGEYLKKGSQVYLEGRIEYGSYTDKNDLTRYTTDIIATEMQMLGSRSGEDPSGPIEDDSLPF